jgi:hypothetical protein
MNLGMLCFELRTLMLAFWQADNFGAAMLGLLSLPRHGRDALFNVAEILFGLASRYFN